MNPTTANNSQQQPITVDSSLTEVDNQLGQKVDIEDVTNINSKISDLFLKKSNLESQLKSLSSRKAKLIAGISIAALTTVATAAAIAIIAALSIPISLVCTIALPVLLGVSVIALTVFIFCLKNTYKEINKHSLKKDSLELKSNELKSKREELKKKFPCISNFLRLDCIFSVEYSKEFFRFKNEDDIDNAKDLIFKPFLSDLHDKGYDFGKYKSKIEKKKENNYISYKYIINDAKNTANNGICTEVKFYYDSKNFDPNQKVYHINGIDISLSKGEMAIAKITRGSTKTQPKTNN